MNGDHCHVEPVARVALSCAEADKLLDLLGHDGQTAEDWDMVSLVRSLYRQRAAFTDPTPPARLAIELTRRDLDLVHRYVTPAAFGPGGAELRTKLVQALVLIDRLEDIPEIEEMEPVDREGGPGQAELLRLAIWQEREAAMRSPRKGGTGNA